MRILSRAILFTIGLPLIMSFSFINKLDQDSAEWRYQVEVVNTGVQGTYQLKVWTYSRKVELAKAQAPKNAVHAVLFKGFQTKGRIKGQKALINDPMASDNHKEFFNDFFKDDGPYSRFVSLIQSGAVAPGELIKVGKEYKVGYTASVSVSELRNYLEEQKIIKPLDSGF